MLSFTDYRGALQSSSGIAYCPSVSSACIDESTTDPSVATVTNPVTGQLTRRIKHFSGYNVFSGYSSVDASSSLMSRTIGAPAMMREENPASDVGKGQRQGYMLAWGRSELPEQ